MKAAALAELLLLNPSLDVVFLDLSGQYQSIEKIIKCNISYDGNYSFQKNVCLLIDGKQSVRRSWLDSIGGEILPKNNSFIFPDRVHK